MIHSSHCVIGSYAQISLRFYQIHVFLVQSEFETLIFLLPTSRTAFHFAGARDGPYSSIYINISLNVRLVFVGVSFPPGL